MSQCAYSAILFALACSIHLAPRGASLARGNTVRPIRVGRRISPDRLFVIVLTPGEGEATSLTLRRNYSGSKVTKRERDVQGALWDPRFGHRLIYCESAIYGYGKVAVWNGGRETPLRHSHNHYELMYLDIARRRIYFKFESLVVPGAALQTRWIGSRG